MKKTALFSRFLEHVLVIKKPFRDAAATMQDPRQHDMIINIIIIVNQDVRQHDHNPRVGGSSPSSATKFTHKNHALKVGPHLCAFYEFSLATR